MVVQGTDLKHEASELFKEIKSLNRKINGREKNLDNFSGITFDHKVSELDELKNIRDQKQKHLDKINKDLSEFWS